MTKSPKADPQVELFVNTMFKGWEEEYDEYKTSCVSKGIQKIEPKDLFMANKMVSLHQFLYSL